MQNTGDEGQQDTRPTDRAQREEQRRSRQRRDKVRRVRTWMVIALLGLILFTVGINPGMYNLDRSETIGFIQMGLWCFGLSLFFLSVYIIIRTYRNGLPNTLLSDVGVRLSASGLVLAVAASYADFLGIGSHARSFLAFGPLQVIGMTTGILISLIGMVLYWPWKKKERKRPTIKPGASGEEESDTGDASSR